MSLDTQSIAKSLVDKFIASSLPALVPGGLVASRTVDPGLRPYMSFDVIDWRTEVTLGNLPRPVETVVIQFRWYADSPSATVNDAIATALEAAFGQDNVAFPVTGYTYINSRRTSGPLQEFTENVWTFTAEYELMVQKT